MRLGAICVVVAAIAAIASCGGGGNGGGGTLVISDVWSRPTEQGTPTAAFYLTVDNSTDEPDELLGASSPRCDDARVHRSLVSDGVSTMRPASTEERTVEPGASLVLGPGGVHVMCIGVDAPFLDGDEVPLELEFAVAGARSVTATVGSR